MYAIRSYYVLCGDLSEKDFLAAAVAETPRKTRERECEAFTPRPTMTPHRT